MSARNVEVTTHINNTPEAVLGYVAEVRNRPLYLPPLKAVADVQGQPGPGQTWKWTFTALGIDWEGTGRCLEYVPGKRYKFHTEGGIASTWTYAAELDSGGTKLTVRVEYDVPERAKLLLPAEAIFEARKKAEAEKATQNLKAILDQ